MPEIASDVARSTHADQITPITPSENNDAETTVVRANQTSALETNQNSASLSENDVIAEVATPASEAAELADTIADNAQIALEREATPELQTPRLQTPELQTPELQTPELQTPELQTPELQTPELETPELETPELETTELETTELATKSLSTQELSTPVQETPQLETSEAESLVVDLENALVEPTQTAAVNPTTKSETSFANETPFEKLRREELAIVQQLADELQLVPDASPLDAPSTDLLDQIFEYLFLYSETDVAVAVRSNETGSSRRNANLAQQRAEKIVDYLVSSGLDRNRFSIAAESTDTLDSGSHRIAIQATLAE